MEVANGDAREMPRNLTVNKYGSSAEEKERLRRSYRPVRVWILFVGESPPASGRFFYQADSGLYRAIRNTFRAAFPTLHEDDFLHSFQTLGCYLVDLCGKPVDRLSTARRNDACRDGEVHLARMLKELQPKIVITVIRSISANVRRAQASAKWKGLHVELPYPGRWKEHRIAFEDTLKPVLRKELAHEKSYGKNVRTVVRKLETRNSRTVLRATAR